MLNTVKNELADVLSVIPSSEQFTDTGKLAFLTLVLLEISLTTF